jgi:hypothetical protein
LQINNGKQTMEGRSENHSRLLRCKTIFLHHPDK